MEVGLGVDGDTLRLTVADRGPGVPPDELPHLFERFRKADPSRSRGGSGLGLAIAREHAELLGGTLDATLRDGGGLRFELRLPVTRPLPAAMSRLPRRSRLERIDLAARRQSDVRPAFDTSPDRSHPRRAHGPAVAACSNVGSGGTLTPARPTRARSRRSRRSRRRNRPHRPLPSAGRVRAAGDRAPEPPTAPSGATSVKIYLFMDEARPRAAPGRRDSRRWARRAQRPVRRPDGRGVGRITAAHHEHPRRHDPARARHRRRPGHGRPVARIRDPVAAAPRCSGGSRRSCTR